MNFFKSIGTKYLNNTFGSIKNLWGKIQNIPKIGLYSALSDGMPPSVERFLKEHGDEKITSIKVVRVQIKEFLNELLNFISLGKWNELRAKGNYDKFYHLSLQINGNVVFEKNQTVYLGYKILQEGEKMDVPIDKELTYHELVNNAIHGLGKEMWIYRALSSNCQHFVNGVLNANHLNTEPLKKFVNQDLGQIAKNMPQASKEIINTTTDIGGIFDNIRQAFST